ncbi:hypothetical protein E2C01_090588 [Portunus trituberculatus]|uniref:Uncharacterized protein n=1 Tax=Portunus trituberculatus TaxID=210409 RepID=A0A5B7JF41_PORTR|nr:hypothetical protein [Portunus trituberculatus]
MVGGEVWPAHRLAPQQHKCPVVSRNGLASSTPQPSVRPPPPPPHTPRDACYEILTEILIRYFDSV